MAYQTRQRDPLFDTNMQSAIEKRGKELIGISLIVVGVLCAMLVASYHPDDPSWISATDEPVRNWLGAIGAMLASPMLTIVGGGAWAIAAVLLVWGMRFILHRGEERAFSRLIFAPIAVALVSIYAATLTPGPEWTHSFGLGGLFGETVSAVLLNIIPFQVNFGLKFISLLSGVSIIALGAFVLGVTWRELKIAFRFVLVGMVVLYAFGLRLLGRGARVTARGAVAAHAGIQARRAQSREEKALRVAEDDALAEVPDWMPEERPVSVHRAEPAVAAPYMQPAIEPAPAPKQSLLARVPQLLKRSEPVVEIPMEIAVDDMPQDDRIREKIGDAIKARIRAPGITPVIAPSLTHGRGPQPLIVDQAFAEPMEEVIEETELPVEPPMTAFTPTPLTPPAPEARKVVQHVAKKPAQPSTRAKAEAQPALKFDDTKAAYEHPPLSLLRDGLDIQRHHLSDDALEQNARMLESVLDDYGVKGEIVSVRPGPVVTMYELEPAPGLKASRVIGLADDIARSMSALSARVSTVPGRSVIGIELPNDHREMVVLREMLSHRDFGDGHQRLPLALGKDIGGDPVTVDLAKMPHLLIAGTTGSGKSVAINTMILSLLYKLTPEECRLILIDPKMLELSVYDGIPHLLSPVVTDPKKAVVALKWTVGEMEERYRKMSKMGVRNIEGYNSRVRDTLAKGELFSRTVQTGFDDNTGEPVFETDEFTPELLPYIVVVVDEMADLMMVAGKEIEACIQRLAQMARASGIHLIMATQRPSVDVITGTIKANFPTRISFQVTSKIDSRTILGEQGAEQLLGMGDMLYMAGGAKITRVHGPFVSDEEVEEIVNHLKGFGPPVYMSGVVDGPSEEMGGNIDQVLGLGGNTDGEDALYDQAVAIVARDRKCSTSYIQRRLGIGYNKAAGLVEQMEEQSVVGAANHVGKREILIPEMA